MINVITGVTGQAGSILAELLLNRGEVVIGVHRRTSSPNLSRLRWCLSNSDFQLAEADLLDFPSLHSLITKTRPTRIFNAAAQSHVHTSFEQPSFTWDVTAQGVLNLLEVIRLTGLDTRLIQFSSSEMFGDQYDTMVLPSAGPFLSDGDKRYRLPCGTITNEREFHFQDENTRMNPQSPYAIAKLAGYHAVRLYRQAYGIWAANAIFFNMESERRGENFVTRKVTKYVADLKRSNFPSLPLSLGNLNAQRDWTSAWDSMAGCIKLADYSTPDDFVFASGVTHTVRDLVECAFATVGVQDWRKYVVISEKFKRPAEVPYLRGYARKAKEKLGWTPKLDFQQLVESMIDGEYNAG